MLVTEVANGLVQQNKTCTFPSSWLTNALVRKKPRRPYQVQLKGNSVISYGRRLGVELSHINASFMNDR